jgi:hypothetical protein
MKHVIIDAPKRFPDDKHKRRCCRCDTSEDFCIKYPVCKGAKDIVPYTKAQGKTSDRKRKRNRRK